MTQRRNLGLDHLDIANPKVFAGLDHLDIAIAIAIAIHDKNFEDLIHVCYKII